MIDSRASDAKAALQDRCAGRTVEKVLVYAINALKTVDPPLAAVKAVSVDAVTVNGAATVEIAAGGFMLSIDLQRTGRLKLDESGREWTPGEPSMPTMQLMLDHGLVANFVEPGKTKRITLRVSKRA